MLGQGGGTIQLVKQLRRAGHEEALRPRLEQVVLRWALGDPSTAD